MKFEDIQLPSNRKFGFFFTAVFGVIAAYFYFTGSETVPIVLAAIAVLFLLVTLVKADLLLPLNKLWMRFGFLLGRIVSPIVLGAIFFLLFTPMGVIMRLAGRDEMRLKNNQRESHWKLRDPIGPESASFKNQF